MLQGGCDGGAVSLTASRFEAKDELGDRREANPYPSQMSDFRRPRPSLGGPAPGVGDVVFRLKEGIDMLSVGFGES